MLFTLLPTTALASEPMPITGGSGRTQTVTNSQLLFAAMADTKVTTIMLDADITIDQTLGVGARTVTLDLNGNVLKYEAVGVNNCISIFPESHLILQDSAPNNTHRDTTLPVGGVITNSSSRGVLNQGTFTMNGGSITNCRATDFGGGVVCCGYSDWSYGELILRGGNISNCTAPKGDGVYLEVHDVGNQKLCADGGEIHGNVYMTYYDAGHNSIITNSADAESVTVFYGDLTKDDGAIIDGHMVTFLKGEEAVYAWEVVRNGSKAVKPETAPIRDDYFFQYWCDRNGNEVDFDTFTITEDTTLTAKWRKEVEAEELIIQIDSLTYNGREQSPTVTIWYGDQKLEKDKDYKFVKDSDISATEVGTYELMIRINGEDIVGQITVPWSIGAATYSGGGGYYTPEDETNKTNKTEETTWSNPFADVKATDWYYHAVQYAHQHKLFAGMSTTEFAPNMPMGRGMLVTVLYRMAGSPAVTGDMPFGDVNSDAYYRNAILWAVQNNIVSGIADDLFAPDANITREQIAIILYRFAQYCGYDTTQGGMQIWEYGDYESISGYALNAMTWAVNSGLLKGKGENTIAPQGTATRAEVAAILQRFIENN